MSEEKKQNINIVHTSCKECCFATYEGDTQIDCRAGMLGHFYSQDRVVDVWDKDKEFFVINGGCASCRSSEWYEKYKEVWDVQLKHEQAIDYQAIITCYKHTDIQAIEKTIKAFMKLNNKPAHVGIILPIGHKVKQLEIVALLQNYKCAAWKIEQIVNPETTVARSINIITRQVLRNMYYVVPAGKYPYKNFDKKLQNKITQEGLTFGALVDSKNESYIIPRSVHKVLYGNAWGTTIMEKLNENEGYWPYIKDMDVCLT